MSLPIPSHEGQRPERRSRRPLLLFALIVVVVAVVGITATLVRPDDPTPAARGDRGEPGASQPFTVGFVPDGFEVRVAGRGTSGQHWGDDELGTDEPFTVLRRQGSTSRGDVIVVSATGFADLEFGLSAAAGAIRARPGEAFTADGREAHYVPAMDVPTDSSETKTRHLWAAVAVDRGDDVAVKVSTPGPASRDDLADIARLALVGSDHETPPSVPHPPDGYEVVGAVDGWGAVGLRPYLSVDGSDVLAPPSAHVIAWFDGTAYLAVVTLPAGSIDLEALAAGYGFAAGQADTVVARDVGGRPGVSFSGARSGTVLAGDHRAVVTSAPWGEVVVFAYGEASTLPTDADLRMVAASVDRTDDATWQRFVARHR